MKYLLAHDLGTSGNKATLFSVEGDLIMSKVESYQTHFYNGNWAEQNAYDWWQAIIDSTKWITERVNPSEIAAVSFSGQMMGCLCVDRHGNPLHSSIIWADQRAQNEVKSIHENMTMQEYYKISGHRNSASTSLQKLMWIKNHEPDIYSNTYKFLNAKDYIVFCLTGVMATDFTDAGGTGALDISNMCWSSDIIDISGLDIDKFPKLEHSTCIAGGITEHAAKPTGLMPGTPVVMGGGDGCCATIGAGVISTGQAYCCVGSSAWIILDTDKPFIDPQMRTFTFPGMIKGHYNACGTMQAAGISYNWMRDELCEGEKLTANKEEISIYEILNQKIIQSPPGAKNLIFLPYLIGERSPRWNPNAKGAFIGLTTEHKHNDMLRSVVEGISLNLSVIKKIYTEKSDFKLNKITAIGGGMKSAIWQQILADVLDSEIIIPNHLEEATSLGAAVAAGVGIGALAGFESINKFLFPIASIRPTKNNQKIYNHIYSLFNDCYEALVEIFSRFSN